MHRKEWVMRALLWTAQVLVGVPFILIGYMKVATPIADLPKTISGKIRRVDLRKMEEKRPDQTRRAMEFWEEDLPELK